MKVHTFNSVMKPVHEKWASEILGIPMNTPPGPDLIDDTRIVEVKFCIIYPGKYKYVGWEVHEHQLDYSRLREKAYWAVGTYVLDRPIIEVNTKKPDRLEKMVLERVMTIIPWEWIRQFRFHYQEKWGYTTATAKGNKLPNIEHAYAADKGIVRFAEGVDPKDFGFNQRKHLL